MDLGKGEGGSQEVLTAELLPITHSPALAANLSSWPSLTAFQTKLARWHSQACLRKVTSAQIQKDERAQLAAIPSHGTAPNSAQKVCQRQASIRAGDLLALSPVP